MKGVCMNATMENASQEMQAGRERNWCAVERIFVSFDGVEIFYRAWIPTKELAAEAASPLRASRALVLFHRGHEHSGRWQGFVEGLGMNDAAVFAWDARGHGKSPGER